MIHIDKNPSDKKLKQFARIAPMMLLLVGAVLCWKFGLPNSYFAASFVFGALIFLFSLLSLRIVRPIYLGLVYIGYPIGWVISHVVMLLLFYGIITPVGLIFRMTQRDALHLDRDPECKSYWTEHPRNTSVERYFKQF